MPRTLRKRLLLIAGLVIAMLILTGIVVYSKGIAVWTTPQMHANQICSNGMRFGFMDTSPSANPQDAWKFKIFTGVTQANWDDPNSGTEIGGLSNVTLDASPFNVWCQYEMGSGLGSGNTCKGTFLINWPSSSVSTGQILAARLYKGSNATPVADLNNHTAKLLTDVPVSNCNVSDTVVELGQTGAVVTDTLVFQVLAHDPNWGDEDGAGIKSVDFTVLGPNGQTVYHNSENRALYCAFGNPGDGPCVAWNFAANNYKWTKSGPALQYGTHTLRTTVTKEEGGNVTREWAIQILSSPSITATPTTTATVIVTPSPTVDTPTATATNTPTPTPTATTDAQATPTATATALPTPNGPGDAYELDNGCEQAKPITSDGASQTHNFHQSADVDWVRFEAAAKTNYLIQVDIPPESLADVTLELYSTCAGVLTTGQDYTFSPGVRLAFTAPTSGSVFLKLLNHDPTIAGEQIRYQVTVRAENKVAQTGALILVAGSLRPDDPIQPNIYSVTDAIYQLFVNHGYAPNNIFYLAPDLSHAKVNGLGSAAALQSAITTWALDRVDQNRALTLYMMDHGGKDIFYLDKQRKEWVTPAQLDEWLQQLETARPGLKVNVVIEACYSGSFITQPQSISRPGRVVLTSASDVGLAWASAKGAYFSDYFLAALDRQESLDASFRQAKGAATTFNVGQTAWLDANGDQVVDRPEDSTIAEQRGFAYTGTLADETWPPYIAHVDTPVSITNGHGVLRAHVLDDVSVQHVWAVIYPPTYVAPTASEALVQETLRTIKLLDQGKDFYAATFDGFQEVGNYRIVLYAEDDQGLTAQPVAITVNTGSRVLLPLVLK